MRILCLRFSALGDVAMTVPVVKSVAAKYPEHQFVVVSRPFAKNFYEGIAPNIEFHAIDLKAERYKGILGMEHLYRDLKALKPDVVADLHDVLRTKYARLRFSLAGTKVARIDKMRAGRKALVRQKDKIRVQQPTSFEKYLDVFARLGLQAEAVKTVPLTGLDSTHSAEGNALDDKAKALSDNIKALNDNIIALGDNIMGIAPFAAHQGKIYPLEKMEEVIASLISDHQSLRIILFGGGKKEMDVFSQWQQKYERLTVAADLCHGLGEELHLMSKLRCMVSMDSANMHLASLVGTPVVSIWGATHPLAGFMGWMQSEDDAVQVDLECRPCSIYGNRPCFRGDYACLNQTSPQDVIAKIIKYIS